jgi:hypothetical protein
MHAIDHVDEAGLVEVASVVLGFVVVGGAAPAIPMQNQVSAHNPPQLEPILGFQL